ncbi:SprT-like domain-containing protein [Comamonas testosteroni]|jgi:predicted SprT family Zn-dependent metalloprotease|uniref:SprT-like domain-containing protein n=1 Tax=Comamonas testosteroni TaxID=285 RepID=UPI0026F144C9|nr:SprT-like domain-containing protein [Comamonas testosteroni]
MTAITTKQTHQPTEETYAELQQAFDHFNRTLFDGQLPSCLITLQREKTTVGYFSPSRFVSADGQTTDELALNPVYFATVPLIETMQTVVHEMAHVWQFHFGDAGRGRYHNKQFADKMESVGLMTSSTGQPGGARTGDRMADYAIQGGRFLQACQELLTTNFRLSWYDRFPTEENIEAGQHLMAAQIHGHAGSTPPIAALPALAQAIQPITRSGSGRTDTPVPENRSNRVKYLCTGCAAPVAVWGKPKLKLICGECMHEFRGV